jgi:acid phosphatase
VAGDYFGMENDDFIEIPANISTVVDLLDTKGISWAAYQENLPYAGFLGFNYSNQTTYAANYVRKHNPLIIFDSVSNNATRLSLIKNETHFQNDIIAQKLPQWSFVTPNMINDGHDTNVSFSAAWTRGILEPLLKLDYFTNNTLIIVSFDESEIYSQANSSSPFLSILPCIEANAGTEVYTVLLGGAVDKSLWGTTDDTFYTHYSTISTVSMNWDLPSLGRWDCDANILQLVANKTGYKNSAVNTTNLYLNQSYPGPLSDKKFTPGWWAAPDTQAKCANGLGVLSSIVATWGNSSGTYNYTNVFPYDALSGTDSHVPTVIGSAEPTTTTSGTSSTSSGAASGVRPDAMAFLGIAGLIAALL